MSLAGMVGAVAVSFILTSAVPSGPPPSQLALERLPGFDLTDGPVTDLDGAGYARARPESVAHLEDDPAVLDGLLATVQTWSGDGSTLVVEIVRAPDDETATGFVDQAAANAVAVGLGPVDPVFGGAWSYAGGTGDDHVDVVAWSQGRYSVVMTRTGDDGDDGAQFDDLAITQAERILDLTGLEVSIDANVDEVAPVPPTGATAPTTGADPDDDPESGPAFPVGGLALIVVAAVVVLAVGRRARGGRR